MNIFEVTSNIEKLEDRLEELKSGLKDARQITKKFKYIDQHLEIIRELEDHAETFGLKLDEYQISTVYRKMNEVESEIYELEEVYKEAIYDLNNKIDELRDEEEYE